MIFLVAYIFVSSIANSNLEHLISNHIILTQCIRW